MITKQNLQIIKQIFFVSLKINNKLNVIIVSHKNNHFILKEIKFSFNKFSIESYVSS